eukprot:6485108-Amphidinium_carterae.1
MAPALIQFAAIPYFADVANHLAEQEKHKRQRRTRFAQPTDYVACKKLLDADSTWAALLSNARRGPKDMYFARPMSPSQPSTAIDSSNSSQLPPLSSS